MITHGSLFTGIGGFDLAAQIAGVKNIYMCENDTFLKKLLPILFPNITIYENITTIVPEELPSVDIISGGFPCQDISVNTANAKGIKGEKSKLVFSMLEIIRKTRPKYAIFENSPMLLKRGMGHLLCELSQIGYAAQWVCLQAKDFGFPHKRERIFIVAYPDACGWKDILFKSELAECVRSKWSTPTETYLRIATTPIFTNGDYKHLCGIDGFPPNFGKVIGAYGNAVNVACAEYIFRCILEFEKNKQNETDS